MDHEHRADSRRAAASAKYEAPRIEDRTQIDMPLLGGNSNLCFVVNR